MRHRSLNTTWHMPDKKQLQRELVRDIQQLTNRLRNEFPELYERLGEMPVSNEEFSRLRERSLIIEFELQELPEGKVKAVNGRVLSASW